MIQSSLNLNPNNTGAQTGTTGNLYIDACPGASGLVTPGMDVAIGTPQEFELGLRPCSERFQISAESISHVTARDLTIGGAIQSMNLYSHDSNQTSNVQGQLIFSTARLSTSPPTTTNSLSGSLVIVSNSSLNLASRLGVHFESAGGVLIQSSSWVATTDPFGLGEADLRITVDQSSTQNKILPFKPIQL